MPGTALPSGTQIAEWGGFSLHEWLTSWSDQYLGRIARHTFDRRDGQQNEDMGSGGRVTRVQLVFDDEAGFDAVRRLLILWKENKTRLFVHPIWGRFNATFVGIESGELRVDQGANVYQVSGQFVESNINAATVSNDLSAAPSRAAKVVTQASTLTATLTALQRVRAVAAAVSQQVDVYTNIASQLATSISSSAVSGVTDSSVSSLLGSTLEAHQATMAAIAVSLGADPSAAMLMSDAEVLSAGVLDAASAYFAQRPAMVQFFVGQPMSLLTVASLFYSGDPSGAHSRVDEIKANNPWLVGPMVQPGKTLQLAAA